MKSFRLVVAVFSSLWISCFASAEKLNVSTQQQFDEAVARINKGEAMVLKLSSNTFVLKQNIIAKSPLIIEGKQSIINTFTSYYNPEEAILIDDGYYVYKQSCQITPFSLFYDDKGQLLEVSESVCNQLFTNYTEEDVVGATRDVGTVIKVPISNNLQHLKDKCFPNSFGYLDTGWGVVNFIIDHSDSAFFYCNTLSVCKTPNYSYDKSNYKKDIRYVIFNAEKQKGHIYYDKDFLYVPCSERTIYQVNKTRVFQPSIRILSDIVLKGVTFIGGNGVLVNSSADRLCVIENCSYKNSLYSAIEIKRSEGSTLNIARINNCIFMQCSLYEGNNISIITPYDNNNHVIVSGCRMNRYPNGRTIYKNTGALLFVGGNAAIYNNVLCNAVRDLVYCRFGAITIRNNFIYNSDRFNSLVYRNLSSDLGLIYCDHIYKDSQTAIDNTQHHITIENNLLYGAYAFGGDARGIFIDDGRGDVECKNNIILNTQIYSMDARNSFQNAASVRNRYEGNIVTSRYRLAAGTEVNGGDIPVTRNNYLLSKEENVVSNIREEEKDVRLDTVTRCYERGGKIIVDSNTCKAIKRSPAWKGFKKFIKKRAI